MSMAADLIALAKPKLSYIHLILCMFIMSNNSSLLVSEVY